jgi:AcrR family transcriptional regulator
MSANPLSGAPVSAFEPPPKRERRKEARPAELLAAALDLFVEKGYAATRAEEVAQRAGVSKGTLFLYFPSKEELFKAVVRQNITSNFAHWRDELAGLPLSIATALHLAAQGWWVHVGATKACGITKLMVAEGFNFPDLARFYNDEVIVPGNQMLLALLQRGVQQGEFRADAPLVEIMHSYIAAMIFLACTKTFRQGAEMPDAMKVEPADFLYNHVDMVLRSLCVHPQHALDARARAVAYIAQIQADAACKPGAPP